MISSTAAPPTPITGPAIGLRLRAIFGRAESTAAACSTSASFMISDGWNCSGPAPSQRRAPLISHAEAGDQHEQQQHERGEQRAAACSGGRARGPWRESRCIATRPIAP